MTKNTDSSQQGLGVMWSDLWWLWGKHGLWLFLCLTSEAWLVFLFLFFPFQVQAPPAVLTSFYPPDWERGQSPFTFNYKSHCLVTITLESTIMWEHGERKTSSYKNIVGQFRVRSVERNFCTFSIIACISLLVSHA